MKSSSGNQMARWSLLTNHGQVLAYVASDPDARLRDVAESVGRTAPTSAPLGNAPEAAGYLTKVRDGRRNRYEVHEELPLRHPRHRHHTVGELIRFLEAPPQPGARSRRA